MSLRRVVYGSTAVAEFAEADLKTLLHDARERNAARGISGILLYAERAFFQVLEGPDDEITSLLESLLRDSRHHAIAVLLDQKIDERDFAEWSMGYRRLESIDEIPGFSDWMNPQTERSTVDKDLSGHVRALIHGFRKVTGASKNS